MGSQVQKDQDYWHSRLLQRQIMKSKTPNKGILAARVLEDFERYQVDVVEAQESTKPSRLQARHQEALPQKKWQKSKKDSYFEDYDD